MRLITDQPDPDREGWGLIVFLAAVVLFTVGMACGAMLASAGWCGG